MGSGSNILSRFAVSNVPFLMVSIKNNCAKQLSCLMTKPTKWHVRPAKTQISLSQLSSCGQRRLWIDYVDAQADLNLRWAHMPFLLVLLWGGSIIWWCKSLSHMIQNFILQWHMNRLYNVIFDHKPDDFNLQMTHFHSVVVIHIVSFKLHYFASKVSIVGDMNHDVSRCQAMVWVLTV